MENLSLQFHGAGGGSMMMIIMAAVTLLLAGWGVYQLVGRKWRMGILCMAAALGPPAAIVALFVDAARRYSKGNARGGRTSLYAAVTLTLGTAAAVALAFAGRLSGGALWMALLTIQVALAVGVFYSSVYAYLGTGRLTVLMALRVAAIGSLMLILFKPVISLAPSTSETRPILEVLVDRSASMSAVDDPGLPNRYSQTIAMLNSQRERLDKHFRVVWHHFGESLQSADSLESLARLSPTGNGANGTDLGLAITDAAGEYAKADQAGILLLSDGIHNSPQPYLRAAEEAGVSVYTVGVGGAGEHAAGQRNIQLVSVDAPLEAIVNNVATIKANLSIAGYPNTEVQVRLAEEGQAAPQIQNKQSVGASSADSVTFKWTAKDSATASTTAPAAGLPAVAGNVRKLIVSARAEPGEATTDDNETEVHILLTQPRVRVLYIEGKIRPEYTSLMRFLSRDPNVEGMCMYRLADNSFVVQGGVGGRQLMALPATDEDFKLFDVIILGDLDRTFLKADQLTRLKAFVNAGGGLIMIGGGNSFGPGGYGDSDIEQVMPVVMGTRQQPQEKTDFVPQLTAEGQAHPIFDGIAGFFSGPGNSPPDAKLPKLDDLKGCVTVVKAKPGAAVLAVHPTRRNEAGPLVTLAVGPFGSGRAAAFTADTTRVWDTPMRAMGLDSPYNRFWGQFIRYMAGVEGKTRQAAPAVVLRLASCYARAGDEVSLIARVQDARGQAPKTAHVSVSVEDAEHPGQARTITLEPGDGGQFVGKFKADKPGKFRLTATATDGGGGGSSTGGPSDASAGKPLGTDSLPLTVAPHFAEMDSLARNDGVLKVIASASRGEFKDISALPEMVSLIVERAKSHTAPPPVPHNINLYNFTALFLLFVALLTAEWLLRRSWQLH